MDNALYVDGNLSVREDEVKVLIGTAGELVDDEHYTPKPAPTRNTVGADSISARQNAPNSVGAIHESPAPTRNAVGAIHESPAPNRNTVRQGLAPAAPTRNTAGTNISAEPKSDSPAPPRPQKIKKLYLRVPDTEGTLYRKARNLAEIFDEGLCVPLVFYNSATKAYIPQEKGIALSPFVMQQLVDLLGKENVIYQ
jgi:hypothetical protein